MALPELNGPAYLALMETVTGISVEEEWRNSVVGHLENAAKMASALENVNIDPDHLDLAGVFLAGDK